MIGSQIGPYTILSKLGEGGMGAVYRARDARLARDVALKILPDVFARDPDRLARFRREAQVLAALNHPNIGAIYGFEEAQVNGVAVHALVLELVEGPTLADVIGSRPATPEAESISSRPREGASAAPRGGGPPSLGPAELRRASPKHRGGEAPRNLNLDDTLNIARQIVDALEAAHGLGIVHRDLKPANIKVRPDGTVKVLDFGLAKLGDAGGPAGSSGVDLANSPTLTSPAMTQLGMILGTAAYMSPEQAKGRVVDKRADIWAFGCVLYEMLTGRQAFAGDDVSDTLANILKTEPQWTSLPSGLPPALRRLIRRCLSKDPATRLPDIGVARLEIADAMAPSESVDGAQPATTAVAPSPSGGGWRLAALGATLIAIVAAVFAVQHLREIPRDAATVRFSFGPPAGTTFPSFTSNPAVISPDGRELLFRARRPGDQVKLWVRSLESSETHVLEGTEGVGFAFWAPNGKTIGFFSQSRIKAIDAAGGRVQVVCDVAPPFLGATWNGDGTILFGAAGGLFRVSETGGSPVPVTTLDTAKGESLHLLPSFLPDGKHFLFSVMPGNTLYLASLDAPSSRKEIRKGDSQAIFADGFLLYARQDTLVAQRFDEASGVLSGDPIPIATGVRAVNGGALAMFSVSSSGVIFYEGATNTEGGKPVWVDRRGAEAGPATALDEVEFPRLSPNGRTLAMVQHGDLWVQDLSGRPAIKLTFDGIKDQHFAPLWSADGLRLIYETNAPAPLRSLPADASSSTPTAVSPTGHFHPHGWTKTGDLLAVAIGRQTTGTDILTFPLGEKSELRDVVATPATEGGSGAALSPDGRWLAYAANPTDRGEVWVRPFPGPGAPVRVSPSGGSEPLWSRNGHELFYIEDGDKLMSTTITPGDEFRFSPPVQLFVSKYNHNLQVPTYDIAPDGRFVMLKPRADASATTLNVIVNWVEEVERRARTAIR